MNVPQQYRKKPLPTLMLKWTVENQNAMEQFVADSSDSGNFEVLDENTGQAQVYDYLHESWITLMPGDYVARGVKGENYPINRDVFALIYDEPGESSIEIAANVNGELKHKIAELEAELATTRNLVSIANGEISYAKLLHQQDITRIGTRMIGKAYEKDYCGDYDNLVNEINEGLTFKLPVREDAVIVTYQVAVISLKGDRQEGVEEADSIMESIVSGHGSVLYFDKQDVEKP